MNETETETETETEHGVLSDKIKDILKIFKKNVFNDINDFLENVNNFPDENDYIMIDKINNFFVDKTVFPYNDIDIDNYDIIYYSLFKDREMWTIEKECKIYDILKVKNKDVMFKEIFPMELCGEEDQNRINTYTYDYIKSKIS
jgi:hypothetical protein